MKPSVQVGGSTIFLTGAASGIGRSTAIEMARQGGRMILTDINEKGLEETCRIIKDNGGTVLQSRVVNICDLDAVKDWADEIHSQFGALDILVNVAGILIFGEVQKMTHKHWEKVMAVNFWGQVHTVEAFVPEMIKARRGHIVSVASLCALVGHPWQTVYTASKHAVLGFTEVLRYDLRQYNIGVSVICPGAVKTGMVAAVEILTDDPEKANKTRKSFSKVGATPEAITARILRAIEKNKYMTVTPDLGWVWYLKRYAPHLYEGYQRMFFWVWNKRMKDSAAS